MAEREGEIREMVCDNRTAKVTETETHLKKKVAFGMTTTMKVIMKDQIWPCLLQS